MRRPKRCGRLPGWIAITAGIIVLLSLIMPTGFWWFMLGVCLIACGICLHRQY